MNINEKENLNEIIETEPNGVKFEQNINVVNIDMGKKPLFKKLDLQGALDWMADHIGYVLMGGIIIVYTIVLIFFAGIIVKYKAVIGDMTSLNAGNIYAEDVKTAEDLQEDTEDKEISDIYEASYALEEDNNEEIVDDTDADSPIKGELVEDNGVDAKETGLESETPSLPTNLYDLQVINNDYTKKVASAKNTVGDEIEDAYYLSAGMYSEIVGFYLNSNYSSLTANLSCAEGVKDTFYVNVYIDEDEMPVKTVEIKPLMAKKLIEIDTTGATFIKFETTGSFHTHGAILSEGELKIAEKN